MGLAVSREEPLRHRSLNCRQPTVAEFVNNTPHVVCTVWIDYTGNERRYYTLLPGARVAGVFTVSEPSPVETAASSAAPRPSSPPPKVVVQYQPYVEFSS